VILADDERRMLDGAEGPAVQAAMELLVKYGEVLGAERLIDTDNVCGANIFNAQQRKLAGGNLDDVFAQISLDSPGGFEIPRVRAHSCQFIGPMDTLEWQVQGVPRETRDAILDSESYSVRHGIHLMNTCTPYQVGNVPTRGEHCAWMESSAVIYVNSVLGAMTNVEGRESAAAAMLTGKIPYWGYHLRENRHATVHVEVTVDVATNRDWGLLGYAVGMVAGETVPVLTGITDTPNLVKLKHFGAAAATSGGVEMYHIPGVTAEAQTLEQALGGPGKKPALTVRYGPAEREAAYARLNTTAADRGRPGDDRLPARQPGPDSRRVRPARRAQGGAGHGTVAVHAARHPAARRAQRLRRPAARGRRGADERHLPGHGALRPRRHPGDRDGLGQAGALPARDHGRAGLVRRHR
jgi:predicted aconitase